MGQQNDKIVIHHNDTYNVTMHCEMDEPPSDFGEPICIQFRQMFPQARNITVLMRFHLYSTFNDDQDWSSLGNKITQDCNLGNNDAVIVYDGDEGVSQYMLTALGHMMPYLGDDTTQFAYITGAFNSQRTVSAIKYEMPKNAQGVRVFCSNTWEGSCAELAESSYIIRKDQPKQKDYMSFNKNLRDYRLLFLGLLKYYNLFSRGHVSYGPNIDDDIIYNMDNFVDGLLKNKHGAYWKTMWNKRTLNHSLIGWQTLHEPKLRLHSEDDEDFWESPNAVDLSHSQHQQDKLLYEAVHYFVITETAFCTTNPCPDIVSADCHFLTEKTYRHIGLRMPFILLSRPGQLAMLRNAGYQTFHPYIDENYDTLDNDQERMLAVIKEMKRLASFNDAQWNQWHEVVDKITEFNYNVLKSKTPEIVEITEELNERIMD